MSAALVLLALFTAACSGDAQPQLYGSKADLIELQDKARPVGKLSSEDAGAEVIVSGTIQRVCQTMGCWFYLAEGAALLYVDLEQGARFTVPVDSAGRRAVIAGTYRADGGDARLVATTAAVWP